MTFSSLFHSHRDEFETEEAHHAHLVRKHGAEFLALLVIFSLVAQSIGYIPAQAATYTTTWTSSTDFTSGCTGTGCVSTSTTATSFTDIATSSNQITIATPAAVTVTETFSGSDGTDYHLDEANSTAAVFNSKLNASPSGIVGWWKFDDATSGTADTSADDSSGNSFAGTLANGPYWTSTTTINRNALRFDGVNDNVNVGSETSTDNLSALTASAWINPTAWGTGSYERYIVSKTYYGPGPGIGATTCTDANGGWTLKSYGNNGGTGRLLFGVCYGTQVVYRGTNDNVNLLNQWNHVAVTWDGSTSASGIHIYVNGVEATYQTSVNGSGTRVNDAAQNIRIGHSSTADIAFSGTIDDVRIYNRALSAAEVSAISNYSSLFSHYKFDEGTGTSAANASGFTANATLTNGPSWVSGYTGNALSFDGTNDHVIIAANTSTYAPLYWSLATSTRTIVARVKKTSSTKESIFSTQTDQCVNRLDLNATTQFSADTLSFSCSSLTKTATGVINDGNWHQVAMVATTSNTTSLGSLAWFVDGVSAGSATSYVKSFGTSAAYGGTVTLGKGNSAVSSSYFSGSLDDFRFYNRALSAGEASSLYNGTQASSTALSDTLATVSVGIASASISANTDTGATYYLSNDNGTTWNYAVPGETVTFANPLSTQLKYKVTLEGTADVSSFSITYTPAYSSSGVTVQNLKVDSAADSQMVTLRWSATLNSGTVKFRTRGATQAQGLDALYSASWSDWITATTTGTSGGAITANGAGGAATPTYRYLEVQASLATADGTVSTVPVVQDVSVIYALNGAPSFDTATYTEGANASQVTDSSNNRWGKVRIDYSVKDADGSTGSTNPNCVLPTFQYSLNNGTTWTDISSSDILGLTLGNLGCGATLQRAEDGSFTSYTAYWNATSTLSSGSYGTTGKIRVKANDNEIIYNIGYATSSALTIDTIAPTTTVQINGSSSTSTVTVVATENTTLKDYMISGSSTFTADTATNSLDDGVWHDFASGTSPQTLNIAWNLTGSASTTVYVKVRDTLGNIRTVTTGVPPKLTGELGDVTNETRGGLFISWNPVYSSDLSGATFSKYEVWRSTDGTTYSLLTSITDRALNYYFDSGLSTTTTYYYKVRTVDSNDDSAPFSDAISGKPGTGATTNAPVITNVSVPSATLKNSSARVTWDTSAISNSLVQYGTTAGSYGSSASSTSYVTSHSVYVTGLSANTTYYFRVRSTDPFGNVTTNDNNGAGYTFTTVGGPVISNVTVSDIANNSATVVWNTTTDSDSYVTYSVNSAFTSSTTVGSASLIGTTTTSGVYTHSVNLTGLSEATTYYYFVKSTDGSGNLTTDDNSGSNYSFVTTRDTTAPTISNVDEPVLSSDSAVIVWTTDERATSQVEYGTASSTHGSYPSQTTQNSNLNVSHLGTLTGLTAKTAYFYRVISADAAGNRAVSSQGTFDTADTGTIIIKRTSASSGTGDTQSVAGPKIDSITVDPITSFGATVNVAVTPASRTIISYGPASSGLSGSAGSSELSSNPSLTLSGLSPGTEYRFTVTAINQAGVSTKSGEQTFKTKFPSQDLGDLSVVDRANDLTTRLKEIIESALPSINPPFISKPVVSDITENSATISWNTNVGSYSTVAYSSEEDYEKDNSVYSSEVSDLAKSTTKHSINLTNLQPGTKYHFSARSFVFPEAVGKSPDFTFNTNVPAISAQILDVKTDSFRLLWKTPTPASSVVQYENRNTGLAGTYSDGKLVKDHDVKIENLVPGETYTVNISGLDESGNVLRIDKPFTVTTSRDIIPPTITNLKIDSTLVPGRTGIIQSVVSWKTDKPANSVVLYDQGTGAENEPLHNKLQDTTSYVLNHVIVLPDLKPATIYRVQVASTDQAGNTNTLPIRTIVTPQQQESIVDIIFKNFGATFPFLNQ